MALPTSRQQREYNKFVEDTAGNVAVRSVLTDASGNDVTRAEDTAHTTGDAAMPVLAVRRDANTSFVDTDGDYAPLQVDDLGYLKTIANDTTLDDDAAYTTASDSVVPMGGYYSVADDTVDSGDAGILAMTANRHLKAQIDGYDTGTDSNKSFEVSPLSSHHVEETLADVTNGTDGTYSYYVDMDGYKNFALQTTLNGGSGTATMTIEATAQDDGTAAASCTYVDVTTALFGAASYTASGYHIVDTPVSIKYLKVQIVAATGAADDADWTLYFKKMY